MPDDDKKEFGIPKGNSVAVVGDPGTGKTMLLLSFFSNLVRKPKASGMLMPEDDPAWNAFNQLMLPKISLEDHQLNGYLRCFVSLENSYARLRDHHGKILPEEVEQRVGSTPSDIPILIDATSLLSGRLEDLLRYPRLDNSSPKTERPGHLDLHLAPCGGKDNDRNRCWHWQEKGTSHPLEHLAQPDGPDDPFAGLDDGLRCITLLTPPVPDPNERVRLLKDLLATLLVRYRACSERILALDSLSALLHPFDPKDAESDASPRRLHMLNLVRWLEEQQVTSFMACEGRRTENNTLRGHPLFLGTEERYLASGVIQLDYHRYPSGDLMRYLRVLKMRGAAHDMRGHAYDLSEKGLAWLEVLFGEAQQGGLHD